jgi:hypothetical protein
MSAPAATPLDHVSVDLNAAIAFKEYLSLKIQISGPILKR